MLSNSEPYASCTLLIEQHSTTTRSPESIPLSLLVRLEDVKQLLIQNTMSCRFPYRLSLHASANIPSQLYAFRTKCTTFIETNLCLVPIIQRVIAIVADATVLSFTLQEFLGVWSASRTHKTRTELTRLVVRSGTYR